MRRDEVVDAVRNFGERFVRSGGEQVPVGPALGDDRRERTQAIRSANPLLPVSIVAAEVDRVTARSGPYGPIAELLADRSVSEVLINGPGRVWVERAGTLLETEVEVEPYEVELLIERVLTPLGLRVDRSSPIVDARLEDGSRVNVVVPPLALNGPTVSIRRFSTEPVLLSAFGPPALVDVLSGLVAGRASILIVGPTSSGKTTLVNTLSGLFDPGDRVICIEDTAELQLAVANLVRLESRPANSEGAGEVTLRDLVRAALRMRPDRLVVGEVRGAEAFDLLLALTSGHRGCLTTCHGPDADTGLRRLETLAAMAGSSLGEDRLRSLMTDGLDAVVTVARTSGSARRVTSVVELAQGRARPLWSADDVVRPRAVVERLRAS